MKTSKIGLFILSIISLFIFASCNEKNIELETSLESITIFVNDEENLDYFLTAEYKAIIISSDDTIALYENGKVIGKKVGDAVITIKVKDHEEIFKEVKIHVVEKEVIFNAQYFNEHLSIESFSNYEHFTKITNNNFELASIKTTIQKVEEGYKVTKTTKEFDVLSSENTYKETKEEKVEESIYIPIDLVIKEEYFEEVSYTKDSLIGKVLSSKSLEFLGVDSIQDISLKIILNNDGRLQTIEINYQSQNNNVVEIKVTVEY